MVVSSIIDLSEKNAGANTLAYSCPDGDDGDEKFNDVGSRLKNGLPLRPNFRFNVKTKK
jgi:hypothetical protein